MYQHKNAVLKYYHICKHILFSRSNSEPKLLIFFENKYLINRTFDKIHNVGPKLTFSCLVHIVFFTSNIPFLFSLTQKQNNIVFEII